MFFLKKLLFCADTLHFFIVYLQWKTKRITVNSFETMKVLSVQQPWASLIVAGIKDVENRTWKPQTMPGRILIHASKKCSLRTVGNEPLEWVQEILNEQLFGNLPDFPDMPDGAIIGYATVAAVDQDNAGSAWASGDSNEDGLYYWHLKDAFVFDEPITGVKGKLHLWDYDLDENNLPSAHQVPLVGFEIEDDNLFIPINKKRWDSLAENQAIIIDLGVTASTLLCKPDVYDLKPFKTITFAHNGNERKFRLTEDTFSHPTLDSKNEPEVYLSLFGEEGANRWIAQFVWAEEIK